MNMDMTASQTVGPYLHIGLADLYTDNLRADGVAGEPIVIEGQVFDGSGQPVPDGMLEIWQANSHGRYAHPQDRRELPLEPGFRGFGRVATDEQGRFRFKTIKPGRVPGSDGQLQAPHILVSVFMRGLIKRLATRIYFSDGDGNSHDTIMLMVPEERRTTLIACRTDGDADGAHYEWNVVVQGGARDRAETVFFDV
jgi:protocatechuate 3,4-dioxygenase alpha subunit